MSTLFYERNPFDILVRNFFQDASQYSPLDQTKLSHPVDIYTNDKGLIFDVACTGIAKEDIEIQLQDNILRINYTKAKEEEDVDYIHKGIAKRSFNFRMENRF
jgi:HSP20 family molecular chaperone IbpA